MQDYGYREHHDPQSYPPVQHASPLSLHNPFAAGPQTFAPLPDHSPSLLAPPDSRLHTRYAGYGGAYASYSVESSPRLSQASTFDESTAPKYSDSPATAPTTSRRPTPRAPAKAEDAGRWKRWTETYRTRNQLVFFAIIGVEAVVVLSMIALVYATIRLNTGGLSSTDVLASDPKLATVATYVSLFVLAVLFEIGITLDACRAKNIMTLACVCAFQFLMLVYSSVLPGQLSRALEGSNADTDHVHNLTNAYAIVIVAVVALSSVCMSAMLWPLYREMGWSVFRKIGADLNLRRMYTLYQAFVCLLKFDAFFLVGFSIQFLILVSGTPTAELVLTIIALPISLVALGLFAIFVRIESRVGVYCSWVVQVLGIAYFIFKISRIFSERSRYAAVRATLTIFAVICIIMLLATFCMMGLCSRNFDQGLRDRVPGYDFSGSSSLLPFRRRKPIEADDEKPARPGMPPRRGTSGHTSKADRTETRMSID